MLTALQPKLRRRALLRQPGLRQGIRGVVPELRDVAEPEREMGPCEYHAPLEGVGGGERDAVQQNRGERPGCQADHHFERAA
jgi:hypothetical protein